MTLDNHYEPIHPDLYVYRVAAVRRVVDGDTFDLDLSLGFHLTAALRFRLLGIDTPEIFGRHAEPAGYEAKRFTEEWFAVHDGGVYVRSIKTESFGRWLADVFTADGRDLAFDLGAAGFG